MRSASTTGLAVWLAVAVAVLGGCAPVGPPMYWEIQAIDEGHASLVVLRATAAPGAAGTAVDAELAALIAEDHPADLAASAPRVGLPDVQLSLTNLDDLRERGELRLRYATEEERAAGWGYLVLPPGQFVIAPAGASSDGVAYRAVRTELRPRERAVYVGSLHTEGVRWQVTSEAAEAERALRAIVGDRYPLVVRPGWNYAEPLASPPAGASVTVYVVHMDDVEAPDIQGDAIRDLSAPGMAVMHGGAAASGLLAFGGLVLAGGGAAIGAVFGGLEEAEWNKHVEPLDASLEALDLDDRIAGALEPVLREAGWDVVAVHASSSDEPPDERDFAPSDLSLSVVVGPVFMQPCDGHRRLCFEVATRVQLRNANGHRLYDRFLLFGNPGDEGEPASYLRRVDRYASVCHLRDLEDQGDALLRAAMDAAVAGIVEHIARDLTVARDDTVSR